VPSVDSKPLRLGAVRELNYLCGDYAKNSSTRFARAANIKNLKATNMEVRREFETAGY
jgi:hypothetical protein